ncbi:MAG: hypothetical protein SGJ18_01575 [Pseudomonadota bacterium]|nr:hypothetical protein [Pseudomonadota bacterium]
MKFWQQRLRPLALMIITALMVIPIVSVGEIEVVFPWGTEVPFPWKQIEGTWIYEKVQNKFEFHVIAVYEDGTRVVQVTELDHDNQILARGLGVAGPDRRIVRAAMQSEEGSYLLLIRAFKDDKECVYGRKLMVVVTIRSMDPKSQTKDRNFVINKQAEEPSCELN